MSTAIVDCGMGNISSVANAVTAISKPPIIATTPHQLDSADRVILPGVGAFADGMHNLQAGGWIEALEKHVRIKGKPLLGICLGMQLLATTGTEHRHHQGLNWIPGTVIRLESSDPNIRIPHIGWNEVCVKQETGLYKNCPEKPCFYFVHSYALCPDNKDIITGTCNHGAEFAASIECENIWATQYHLEKSQKVGLTVLSNFLNQKA